MDLDNFIKMYVCGPTVYNDAHIGHARVYMMVDLINKIMNRILNKNTLLVMNITDIDDKIIKAAENNGITWQELSKKYEDKFFASMAQLNIDLPDVIIRVSESIIDIIEYIQNIINNNFAYVTNDGSVYFDTISYKNAGYDISFEIDDEEINYESQLSSDIINQKRHKKDFALWKSRPENNVGFDAIFSFNERIIEVYGIPGWHIECSTMIHKTIGNHLDIHFGGIDLKFPHHHNENLQACAYYHPEYHPNKKTKEWTNKFMHIGHLCIKGKKMSKSLKNFSTIDDILKELTPNEFRWMFMQHKWEQPMEFNDGVIENAKNMENCVKNLINRTKNYPFDILNVKYTDKEFRLGQVFDKIKNKIIINFETFNVDIVVTELNRFICEINSYLDKQNVNKSILNKIMQYLLNLLINLGFSYEEKESSNINEFMDVLITTRTSLRNVAKNKSLDNVVKKELYSVLDKERNILLPSIGINLEDTRDSSLWFQK
ncbi:cysteinyl-tRNA synthetase-like protein [Moumouvirus goulette]|uniref:Cysteinyl-tRNA synthetase-like protein n=1 Tax=Moumouvirus goulette TaxID=1247379 RepID=M1PG92_9VIRU|nr:cysteinyl-tRNA synthetase-like protein [Moumouvirus goulette]AGF84998.1 cysteinyl-tRNA synthetase-like protein [Moumouvirus goulette]